MSESADKTSGSKPYEIIIVKHIPAKSQYTPADRIVARHSWGPGESLDHATVFRDLNDATAQDIREWNNPASASLPTATQSITPTKSLPNQATPPSTTTTATVGKDNSQDLRARDAFLLAEVSRQGSSYVVTPKVTVAEKTGVYPNFLAGGQRAILPGISRTHRSFRFWPVFEKGVLIRLELHGVDDNLWTKDLRSPLVWAFDRAREGK